MAGLTPISPVTRVSSKVIRILGSNPGPMTLQGTNTYIVGNGPKRILIDTGEKNNQDYIKLLTEVLKKENISLEHIIVTHWHPDHIGGLEDVAKSADINGYSIWKYPRTDAPEGLDSVKINFLTDGEEISSDGATLKVVHTPGHTTDHASLLLKEENALFSGDCILGEGTVIFESLEDYIKSLKKLLILNPSKIYPGHGPVIEDGKGKIKEYIKHREMREATILNFLQGHPNQWLNPEDIVSGIYPGVPERIQLAALVVINQHLGKLLHEGKVDKVNESWKLSSKGE